MIGRRRNARRRKPALSATRRWSPLARRYLPWLALFLGLFFSCLVNQYPLEHQSALLFDKVTDPAAGWAEAPNAYPYAAAFYSLLFSVGRWLPGDALYFFQLCGAALFCLTMALFYRMALAFCRPACSD